MRDRASSLPTRSAPIRPAPRRRMSVGSRPAMPQDLLSELRQVTAARQTVAPYAPANRTIGEAAQMVRAARAVTGRVGGDPNAPLNAGLTDVLARNRLRVRPGPANATTLSPVGTPGIGLAVAQNTPTAEFGDMAYQTRFLRRGARAVAHLQDTFVGSTLVGHLNQYTRAQAGQLHNEPAMTITAVQQAGEGIVGSSAQEVNVAAGRGGTQVRWDMAQVENPSWSTLTNDTVLLGHEAIHALRRTRGENYFTNPRGAVGEEIRRREELETTGLTASPNPFDENLLRGAMGVRPRLDYGGLQPAPGIVERGRRAAHAMYNWAMGASIG
jgi:hypothetical protein